MIAAAACRRPAEALEGPRDSSRGGPAACRGMPQAAPGDGVGACVDAAVAAAADTDIDGRAGGP